jgi:hypothetical protein
VKIKVTAGPDAGWEVELRAGRHIVGRSRHCAVVIDDPSVEPYHVLLTIDDEGGVNVVQLAGRTPVATAANHMDVCDSRLEFGTRSHVAGLVLGVTVPDPLDGGGGVPVVVDVDTLAIVDADPEFARGQAIVRSLHSQAARQGLTAPDFMLTTPDDPALDGCTSILELGARWRGRWTPDVSQPVHSIRLHAAGASKPHVHVALITAYAVMSAT